jgi:putative transcriptional regulator
MLFARDDTYAAFMMDHAAGNHPESLALAGDLHMLLSQAAARTAFAWSIIGGALLEADEGERVRSAPLPDARQRKAHRAAAGANAILDLAANSPRWKRGLSGVPYCPVGVSGGRLMKLEPGQSVPKHGHSAIEATVIIQGELEDTFGVYRKGDLMLGEPGVQHKPVAAGRQTCVCYVADPPRFAWRLQ